MLFSKNKDWNKPFAEKVAKRVARIPTGELESWAEQSLIDISKCLSMYSKNRDAFYLKEAEMGAEALHAVVNQLNLRMTKP